MRSTGVRTAAIVVASVAAVFLAACGSSSGEHAPTSTSAASAEVATHNDADVAFARNMIPHHLQAVDLAGLAQANTTNGGVIALANQIAEAQLSEIQAFNAWLVQSNAPQTGSHDSMTGMVDQATMDKLKSLHGPDFDKLWLQSMIGHHQGAIAMAQQEIAHGSNEDMISIARSIVSTQQAEIDKMKQLLGG